MGCGASSAPKSKYEDKAIEPAALGRRASRENVNKEEEKVPAPRKSRPSLVGFKSEVQVVQRAQQPGEPTPKAEDAPKEEVLALDGQQKPKPERQITTFARSSGDDEDEDEEEEEAEETHVDFDQKVVAQTQEQVDEEIIASKPNEEIIPPLEEEEEDDGGSKPVKRLSKTRERVPTCHFKKGGPGGVPFNMDDIMDSSDEEVDYADEEAAEAAEGAAAEAPADEAPAAEPQEQEAA